MNCDKIVKSSVSMRFYRRLFCFVRVSLTGSKLAVLAVRVDFVTRACLLSRTSLRNIYIYMYVYIYVRPDEKSGKGALVVHGDERERWIGRGSATGGRRSVGRNDE